MAIDAVARSSVESPGQGAPPQIKGPIVLGFVSGLLLLGVYAGIIVAAQGLSHLVDQASRLWYWLLLLSFGFGTQAGLFAFVRRELKRRQASATASIAASGGVSAGSMVACCAHHLTDVLAVLGISGVAAFLVAYQVPFIVVGIVSNAVGITMMLEIIQRHRLCPVVAASRLNFGRIRNWTLASSSAVVAIVFLSTFLARRG